MLPAAYAAYGADPISARRQFKALAQDGDPRAQAAYALMLASGQGGGTDPAAAARWYRLAADQGHAVACYALAGMYLEGRGLPADPELARQWYRAAADLGDRDALFLLGTLEPDPGEALRWWRRAAARGHASAAASVGRALLPGGAVPPDSPPGGAVPPDSPPGEAPDVVAAAVALLDAATAGDDEAVPALARVLEAVRAKSADDPGAAWVAAAFADDPAEAQRLRAQAVDGGYPRACLQLAEQLRREAPGDSERWWALVERAAAGGSPEAWHELGTAWATGAGVARDPRKAAEAFREAARWGRPESLHGLGAALLEVASADAERDEARTALYDAALAGDAPAMFLYAAQVVGEDRVEALRWLIEAADSGHADALVVARKLVATLTPDDVRQADRATRTDGSVALSLLAGEADAP